MSFDDTLKQQFGEVVNSYGLTIPQAFKLFAKQVTNTGVLPLSFDYNAVPNETTLRSFKEVEEGKVTRHKTMDSFINSVNQVINE